MFFLRLHTIQLNTTTSAGYYPTCIAIILKPQESSIYTEKIIPVHRCKGVQRYYACLGADHRGNGNLVYYRICVFLTV